MPTVIEPSSLLIQLGGTPARAASGPGRGGQADSATGGKPLTVADVVLRIKSSLERQFHAPFWVEGELSNCSYPASGHIYFTLVDEQVTDRFGQRFILPCVFYRNANQGLRFKLVDGMKVLCFGQVTVYEPRGQYQLKVLRVEPKGIGALQLAFEQLKKRLTAEGLFDEARKRPIPKVPNRIGLVTSTSGSAIHDLVSKLRGRFDLIILPVKVQGDGAAAEIAAAIKLANRLAMAEVLIVGRGGGSVEDLWAFNEEPVARAIASSRIPVISAVGHQDDWTMADYAADLRASTPTDAAKLLCLEQQTFIDHCRKLVQQLGESMGLFLDEQTSSVESLSHRLRLLHPLHQLDKYSRLTLQWQTHLVQSMSHALDREERHVQALIGRLQALSPLAVLARGYSITFRLPAPSEARQAGLPQRHVLTDASSVHPGEQLKTKLAKGCVVSTVTTTHADSALEES